MKRITIRLKNDSKLDENLLKLGKVNSKIGETIISNPAGYFVGCNIDEKEAVKISDFCVLNDYPITVSEMEYIDFDKYKNMKI